MVMCDDNHVTGADLGSKVAHTELHSNHRGCQAKIFGWAKPLAHRAHESTTDDLQETYSLFFL